MPKTGVVAFGFGVPSTTWANREISTIASTHAIVESAPIFTQLDVQLHAGQTPSKGVEYLPGEDPKKAPLTLRIALWVIQRAIEEGLGEIIVVAARPHIWRAMRDLEQAAIEVGFH